MKKRFVAIILSLALALCLSACNRIEDAVKDAVGDVVKDAASERPAADGGGGGGNPSAPSGSDDIPPPNAGTDIALTDLNENPASDFRYTIDSGSVTITRYIGDAAKVRIPAKIEGLPVVEIKIFADMFDKRIRDLVTEVYIPDSVTSIGREAFHTMGALETVHIPDSVTNIGIFAFTGAGLKSVTIPGSLREIGGCVFMYNNELLSVTIGSGATFISDSMFLGCPALSSVTIPDTVTTIGRDSFGGCTSLQSIVIPDSVIHIGVTIDDTGVITDDMASRPSAFQECLNLTSAVYKGVSYSMEDGNKDFNGWWNMPQAFYDAINGN